ncbi:hypothetical protein JET18_16590 [Chryseobacterium sp. L7]|uniref:Uncharacterized protein n=1 Tax=Chryseobacterium endalhagicum TaxID=2797638 RepID=A0ABS1QIQ0_9FLAO|nr:hypothetical protein [Chryseobacterium endalhagicum]MBL1222473.1 hypothetical protein [Chryseobacterium endalhagicum]
MENTNYKKIGLAVFSILMILCNGQQNSQNKAKQSSGKINRQGSAHSAANKTTYIAHVNAMSPYELYLDDILIDFYYGDNMSNTTELNPYLLGNGKHTLKIRFLPKKDSPDTMVQPKDIIFNETARWHIYFSKIVPDKGDPLGYSNEIDYAKSELKIQAPPEKVAFWEQTWEVDVKDLPYHVTGWSESQDLKKTDKDVLQKEVVAYFSNIKDLLNSGKIDEYLKLRTKEDEELDVVTYTTPEDSKIDYQNNKEKMLKLCPGNMQPIDHYEMKIYGNGKLVTLVIPDGKFRNWTALISKTPKGRTTSWGILLHKPKGSSTFEIIRK